MDAPTYRELRNLVDEAMRDAATQYAEGDLSAARWHYTVAIHRIQKLQGHLLAREVQEAKEWRTQ